jgi:hypothetical protein
MTDRGRMDLIFRDICSRAYRMRAERANERAVEAYENAAAAITERDNDRQRADEVLKGTNNDA